MPIIPPKAPEHWFKTIPVSYEQFPFDPNLTIARMKAKQPTIFFRSGELTLMRKWRPQASGWLVEFLHPLSLEREQMVKSRVEELAKEGMSLDDIGAIGRLIFEQPYHVTLSKWKGSF